MLRFIRVYDADTTLEAILKGALSTTSSEYLRLDNHILASCSISVGIASFRTNSVLKLTDLLCYSFCLLCSLRIRAIRDPDAVLAQPSALHNVGWIRKILTDFSRLAERYSWMERFLR
jgi:hypothetical protein